MTGQAVITDRSMWYLVLGNFLAQVLMTAEAELAARLQQVHFVVGRMRIMTGNTFAFTDDLVGTSCIHGNQPVMAAETDLGFIFSQQLAVVGRMRIMTSGTITFREWSMDEFLVHRLFEPFMAAQAELPPGPRGQVEWIRGPGR